MKKITTLFAVVAMLMATSSVMAQNDFKGTLKYSLTSTGEVAVEIPAEIAEFELKVMDNMVYANEKAAQIFTSMPFNKSTIVNDRKVTTAYDFSQLLAYIAQSGEEFATYKGDGKMIVSETYSQEDIDSLTIPVTEGFYFEYVDGKTKEVAGRTAKLALRHLFDDNGTDHVVEVWYDETMGPANNFLFFGIKGMPLQMTLPQGEGKAITMTVTEIKKGKVKEVDFLMPSGYKTMTEEEMKTFFSELQEVMEYLQD